MEEGYLAKIVKGDGSKEIKVGEVFSFLSTRFMSSRYWIFLVDCLQFCQSSESGHHEPNKSCFVLKPSYASCKIHIGRSPALRLEIYDIHNQYWLSTRLLLSLLKKRRILKSSKTTVQHQEASLLLRKLKPPHPNKRRLQNLLRLQNQSQRSPSRVQLQLETVFLRVQLQGKWPKNTMLVLGLRSLSL